MKNLEDEIDETKQLNGHVYHVILWCTQNFKANYQSSKLSFIR